MVWYLQRMGILTPNVVLSHPVISTSISHRMRPQKKQQPREVRGLFKVTQEKWRHQVNTKV